MTATPKNYGNDPVFIESTIANLVTRKIRDNGVKIFSFRFGCFTEARMLKKSHEGISCEAASSVRFASENLAGSFKSTVRMEHTKDGLKNSFYVDMI